MGRSSVITWYRVLLALLGFSALVTELATVAERGTLVLGDFFGYFTVETNAIAVAVLLWSATSRSPTRRLELFRGASTTFLVTVFIAFSALLAGLDVELTAVPWDNVVLHYLMPLGVALDWVVDPPSRRIAPRVGSAWLAFPLAYLVYSLIRGELVGWYPYPFLDPAHGGYQRVAVVSLGIAVIGAFAMWLVTRLPRAATRRKGE